jgi:hypothetical protein
MDVNGVSLSTASSLDLQCVSLSGASCMDVQGVSLSNTSSMDMQGVPLSITNNVNVQGVSQSIAYRCAGYMYFFPLCKVFLNAGLIGILSVQYEQICRYRNQSGTGIRGSNPLPECSGTGLIYKFRNADTDGIGLDADAHLWIMSRIPDMHHTVCLAQCHNDVPHCLSGSVS